ncbi:sortase [Bifidobacterium adolescentis]|uniref:sortase n=1 Tax=Bifidobacterium adolescentis TaxID=1680 RepID=UPI003D08EF6B
MRHGTDSATLEKSAGHLYGTSLPVGDESTHAVIAAHRGLADRLMFTNLGLAKKGDLFEIDVQGERLHYKVTNSTGEVHTFLLAYGEPFVQRPAHHVVQDHDSLAAVRLGRAQPEAVAQIGHVLAQRPVRPPRVRDPLQLVVDHQGASAVQRRQLVHRQSEPFALPQSGGEGEQPVETPHRVGFVPYQLRRLRGGQDLHRPAPARHRADHLGRVPPYEVFVTRGLKRVLQDGPSDRGRLRAVALQAVLNVGHVLVAQRVDAPRAGYPVQPHDGVLVASPAVRTQVGLGPLVVPSLQPVHEARRRRVRREALAHICVQLHPEPRVRHRLGLALGREPPSAPGGPVGLYVYRGVPDSIGASVCRADATHCHRWSPVV